MDLRKTLAGFFLASVLPLPVLSQTSDFQLPRLDFGAVREMVSGGAVPAAAPAPVQLAAGQQSPQLVKLTLRTRYVSAGTEWGQLPEVLRTGLITVEAAAGNQDVLKDVALEVAEVKDNDKYKPGTGSLRRDPGDASRWDYLPFTEPKTEKHPRNLRVVIVPKHEGRVCGEPVTIDVRTVFNHLTLGHAHTPGGRYEMPQDDDYNLAWRYVKWKYDVDTSHATSVRYDKSLTTMGVTNMGVGGVGRYIRLGPTAFNSENICASVLGHEHVHAGQSFLTFVGPAKYAEPPAYQWELDNAARFGVDASYVSELRAFKAWYEGTGPKPNF